MTKSLIITYNEADESLLMALFKKFKIETQIAPSHSVLEKVGNIGEVNQSKEDFGDNGVPEHVVTDIIEGLEWIKKVERGEVEEISWEQMMSELQSEEEAVTL